MYLILNLGKCNHNACKVDLLTPFLTLGLSDNFEAVKFNQLEWPARMGESAWISSVCSPNKLNQKAIDYVRVWVQDDFGGVGCSPSHRPTEKYINDHLDVYSK